MLNQRIINAIFLLHEAAGFKLLPEENISMPCLIKGERNELIQTLIVQGYLDNTGMLCRTLDQISLFDILCDLEERIALPAYNHALLHNTVGVRANSLHALEHSFTLWLKSIKLSQL